MNARALNAAAGVIAAALKTKQTPMGIAFSLAAAGVLQSPETARRLRDLEDIEQRLLALLPREPCPEYGLPNDLAAAQAAYGVWQLVADVLGVAVPYERPADEDPIAYGLTPTATAAAFATVVDLGKDTRKGESTRCAALVRMLNERDGGAS